MPSAISSEISVAKTAMAFPTLLTAIEAARILKVSSSFLAKKRLTGDGPAFVKLGRSVRYSEVALFQWMKSRQRLSTSEK
jgi:hypothetical protein